MKLKSLAKVFSSVAVVAVVALVMALMVGCSSDSSKADFNHTLVNDGELTVATSLDNAPFESFDGDTPTGYGVAVIQEVAKRLNLECDIKNIKRDSIVSEIASGGQFDVGISSIAINSEHSDSESSEEIDFSDPYYIADQALVITKGAYASASKLKGKTVAAQTGSKGFDYAQKNISDNVVGFDEASACFAALQAKNAEAVVVNFSVAKTMIASSYPNCEILETIATGEEYGIAINKENTALKDAINKALKEMDKDGTLKNLQEQYLK